MNGRFILIINLQINLDNINQSQTLKYPSKDIVANSLIPL